ncbi:MAG: 5-formyltetrahydrofolate cyclo-ligase [Chloroflexales bacterium]
MDEKHRLRRELMTRRDQTTGRDVRSEAIRERVLASPVFQHARAIHCYLSIRSEVDTHFLIAIALTQGKAVAIPVLDSNRRLRHSWINGIDPADFTEGVFGTLAPRVIRPVDPGDWDLTIVPMFGFDRDGYRIGYGMGYYDRLLAAAPTTTLGVAFSAQEVAALPHAPHDMPLDFIATEDEMIEACAILR